MSNSMKTISVIMPAYNCERYLEEAVDSVIAQTFTDWELLIIDDCSKDRTYALMQRLEKKDERIRILQNPHNLGAAGTRNRGIRKANGQWIAFLDSDDLWRCDKLELQMEMIRQHPEAEFLFTGSAFIEDDGMTIAFLLEVPATVGRKKLLKQNVISCSSVLIKKEHILAHPMPEQEGIHEDFATWLSILDDVPCAYGVNEPLLIYRRAKASKSGDKQKSANMNWNTYTYAQIPLFLKLICMFFYTVNGVTKYGKLWWKSSRLMMKKERFKNLFLFVMSALLVTMWTVVFGIIWFKYYNFREVIGRRYAFWGYAALLGLYAAFCILVGKVFSTFRVVHQSTISVVLAQIYTAVIVNVTTYIELALIGRWKFMAYVLPMMFVAGCNLLIGFLWAAADRWLYGAIYPPHEILLIHDHDFADRHFVEELQRQGDRYQLKTEMTLADGRDRILAAIRKHECVMLGDIPMEERNFYVRYCFEKRKRCYCQTTLSDIIMTSAEKMQLSDMTIQLFKNCGLTFEQRFLKRLADLLFSLVVIIVLSPVYLLLAMYVKLSAKGSVFSTRECLTKGGNRYNQYKFRTTDAHTGAAIEKLQWMSRMHLDELPQFFNILRGEISVVGPYPDTADMAIEYEKQMPEYSYRYAVKAGLTGYAKIHGNYNSSRRNQLKMDLYYIQNYSLAMDLNLVAATAKVLFEPQRDKKAG